MFTKNNQYKLLFLTLLTVVSVGVFVFGFQSYAVGDICSGALERHTDSVTGVTFCVLSTDFETDRCTSIQGMETLEQRVGIINNSQYNGYIQKGGFSDPVAGCGATQASVGASGFTVTGGNINAGQSGIVTFSFDASVHQQCGRVQLDAAFHGDGSGGSLDRDGWNILGKVVNYQVNCGATPTPTPTPVPTKTPTPTPTHYPTPTCTPTPTPHPTSTPLPPPTCTPTPTPTPLTCKPQVQSTYSGTYVAFTAYGGEGYYRWSAPGGYPSTGLYTTFKTKYTNNSAYEETKYVTLTSGNQTAHCEVRVIPAYSPTPTPSVLTCSPSFQNVQEGQLVSFRVYGGEGYYHWNAPGGNPSSGMYDSFSTRYNNVGNGEETRTVTVTSAGKSATCSVVVSGNSVSPSITKLVRNITSNSSEQDNVLANPNDTVEFIIRYSANGNAKIEDARIYDSLPANLRYINGSTTLDGQHKPDGVAGGGLFVGDIDYGRTITVKFRAQVATEQAFSQGSTTLTNSASVQASNVPTVSDTATVLVSRTININDDYYQLQINKYGRNITKGQNGEFTSVTVSPNDTVEFIIKVRSHSNTQVYNAIVSDALPVGFAYTTQSTTIDGAPVGDGIVSDEINIGNMDPGQEVVIKFRAIVTATGNVFPSGSNTVQNTANVRADNIPTISASLPLYIGATIKKVAGVQTGPAESLFMALVLSSMMAYGYLMYSRTNTSRRLEAIGVSIEHRKSKDRMNFARYI